MGLETLDKFADELYSRKTESGFDSDAFTSTFKGGLVTPAFQERSGVKKPERGFLKQTGTALAGGLVDSAELWMRAVRTVDPEGGSDVIRNFASGGLDSIQNFIARHPSLSPDAQTEEGVKRWWVEGVRSFVPSMSAAIPGVIGGGLVGGPLGAAVGSTFGGVIFGLAEHDKFKDEVEQYITDNQLSPEEGNHLRELSRLPAVYSAVTEGGLEGAANALELLSVGLFRPVRRTIQGIARKPIKELFKLSAGEIAKKTAKVLPRTLAIEIGTEVTQAGLETKFRRDIGLTDISSMDAAMQVIGPAAVTTLLFMGAAGGANSVQRFSIRKNLEEAKANPNARAKAVHEVSDIIRNTGQPDSESIARQFKKSGLRFIEEGVSIPLERQLGVQNYLGEMLQGLESGEVSIEKSESLEKTIIKSLESEEITGTERITTTQMAQGLSAINQTFRERLTQEKKKKTRKRKATPEEQLMSLAEDAIEEGKEPETIEQVEEEIEEEITPTPVAKKPTEALEELAEEVTEPVIEPIKEEIPVEEPEAEEIREEREVAIEKKAPEKEERKEERRIGISREPITVEMLEAKPSLAFAVIANKEFAADQAAIDKAEEMVPEERRVEERRKAEALATSQVFKPILPGAPKEEIEKEALPEAVPIDVRGELETVQTELDEATVIFVRAETKGKAKREAKAEVEALQARRKELRIAAGIELNPVDQSRKNITDKMGVINLGVDPTILKDMTVVGAHHFNSGLKTFISWSKAMINDLGKPIKNFLRRIWRTVRGNAIPTDETTELQKEAVKIEGEQHPDKKIQAEQVKTIKTSKNVKEGKEAKKNPDIIDQINHFVTHNEYNVLHNDKSRKDTKDVFSDIQDEDISTLARISGLPYWKAKKFIEWERAVGIEIKRTENKNLLKFEFGRKVFKRSEVDEGSRADKHEFFELKGESEQKVSAVILEGDARRTEFTNKQLREGILTVELDKVADEYKAFRDTTIKLNEEEITAYRAWQVTMKKVRRQMLKANEDLLYKPFEGKPWIKDLRNIVAKKAEQVRPAQATLGLEEQKIKEELIVPELTARDIPENLSALEQKQFVNAYNTVIKPKSRIQELRKQMGELKGYVPHLQSEGTVKVSFIDNENQVRDFKILKNLSAANKWITERKAFHKARGNDYTVLSPKKTSRTPEFLYQEVTAAALERFSNKALDRLKLSKEGKEPGKIKTEDLDEIREAMKQALADELNVRGFGERFLRRTRPVNIGGYRVDNLKDILAGYISGASGFITKMEAAYEQGQLLSDINIKTKPNLYQEVNIYGRNMMRNLTRSDQISSRIRTTAFMWYLSGQLKSPTVNFTQNWILGIPTLAKFTTGARRKYNRAMFDVATNRLSDSEKKALLEAGKKGITGDQLMQDIFGQVKQDTNKSLHTLIKILSFPFSASEILNRKFAFLARFRAGIEKGETSKQAFDGAREFVFDVHFLYGKLNQPIIASGGTPFSNALRTSLTFRNYTFNYLDAMKTHIGDRNFMLVGRSLAYMALLGGLSSLPFLEDFLDMWERFTGIPIRKKIQQELKGVGGDVLAVMGTQGLPSLLGVDLSGSLRIHLPDPTDPARLFEESVFGVYEGLAVKAKDSFKSILDGEPLRALEQGAPIFIEKPLKAWRVSRDGKVTTKTGKTIFTGRGEPLQITTREAIIQAIGFRPSKLAFESAKFRQFTNIESFFRNWRSTIFRTFRFAETQEDKDKIFKEIREYNERAEKQKGAVPPISPGSLRKAVKERPSRRFGAFVEE